MDVQPLFFAIDCIGIFVAIAIAIALIVARPRDFAAQVAAFINLTSAGFIVFSRAIFADWIPEPYRIPTTEPVMLMLQVLMNTTPGAFMLLAFALFQQPIARFPRPLWALFALQVGLEDLIPYLFGVTTHPSLVPTMTDASPFLYAVFEATPALLEASFVAIALWWTAKDWRADLVDSSRLLRALLIAVIGVNIVSYTLLTRLVLSLDDIRLLYVHEAYMALNIATGCAVLALWRRLGDLRRGVDAVPAIEPASVDPTDELDYAAFRAAMDARIYHEAGLTIASLATRLSIPEYRLRRLINARLGHRNFNQMLHAHRIAEAREALADPAQRRLPILTIALSVGYQSINPFNRAFRELTGTTPSAFRQHAFLQQASLQQPSLQKAGQTGNGASIGAPAEAATRVS